MGKQHLLIFIGNDFGTASLDNPLYVANVKVIQALLPFAENIYALGENQFSKLVLHLAKKANIPVLHDSHHELFVIGDSLNGELTAQYKDHHFVCFDAKTYNEAHFAYWLGELAAMLPLAA